MKNTKKIVSLILAICMIASLAISASAPQTPDNVHARQRIMIADVIALNPCAKLPQKSTNSRTFLGIYKINVKISVKNDPNTKLLALEQF